MLLEDDLSENELNELKLQEEDEYFDELDWEELAEELRKMGKNMSPARCKALQQKVWEKSSSQQKWITRDTQGRLRYYCDSVRWSCEFETWVAESCFDWYEISGGYSQDILAKLAAEKGVSDPDELGTEDDEEVVADWIEQWS